MSRFIEIQMWGWNVPTLVFVMVIFFGLYGAWGLYRQIQKVQHNGSESVSVIWSLTFAAMFSTYLPYGLIENKLAIFMQFWFRVPFYLVLLILVHKDRGQFKCWEWTVFAGLCVVLTCIIFDHKIVFTSLSFIGALIAADQPRQIWKNRRQGSVSVDLLWAYMASIIFWLAYGYYLHDPLILSWATAYTFVYSTGLWMYYKYPNPTGGLVF